MLSLIPLSSSSSFPGWVGVTLLCVAWSSLPGVFSWQKVGLHAGVSLRQGWMLKWVHSRRGSGVPGPFTWFWISFPPASVQEELIWSRKMVPSFLAVNSRGICPSWTDCQWTWVPVNTTAEQMWVVLQWLRILLRRRRSCDSSWARWGEATPLPQKEPFSRVVAGGWAAAQASFAAVGAKGKQG